MKVLKVFYILFLEIYYYDRLILVFGSNGYVIIERKPSKTSLYMVWRGAGHFH